MSTTTVPAKGWGPRTTMEPTSWLLTNGQVIMEPPLEESTSGRKVRIAGTNLSAFSKDIDELVYTAVRNKAHELGTQVWRRADPSWQDKQLTYASMHPLERTPAKLHLTVDGPIRSQNKKTVAWWRFRHSEYHIDAVVVMALESSGSDHQVLTMQVLLPSTHPEDARSGAIRCDDGQLGHLAQALAGYREPGNSYNTMREVLNDWLRHNPWHLADSPMGRHVLNTRQGVKKLLEAVRKVDDLDVLQIPDLREVVPGWLDLQLHSTNVNEAFVESLVSYLDGAPTMTEAAEHYQGLLSALRSAGIVVEVRDNDLLNSLIAGTTKNPLLNIGKPQLLDNRSEVVPDGFHTLSVNLATGSFVVTCIHMARDEIAHKWDEAVTLASLTGQDDELLAFAKAYVNKTHTTRAKAVDRAHRD